MEYQPLKHNQFGIHKVLSRIKAEEEIWNKVVDELFRLDELVSRDKELRHLSRYVKDVFGIKMVVSRAEDIEGLFEYMSKLAWSAEQLKNLNVSKDQDLSTLTVLEVKNYSPKGFQKESNWQALKVVFQWAGRTFEIQIQPLEVYHLEKEVLTQESHEGFKTRRERIRDDVAAQYPLFQFYRQLLRWLFENPGSEAPRYRNVKVLMR